MRVALTPTAAGEQGLLGASGVRALNLGALRCSWACDVCYAMEVSMSLDMGQAGRWAVDSDLDTLASVCAVSTGGQLQPCHTAARLWGTTRGCSSRP